MTHLAFIRSLPCCRCGRSPSQAAHLRMGTGGGMGMKPDDRWTVPLCADCHQEQHRVGEPAFWGYDPVDDLARRLAEVRERGYPRAAAVSAILMFRLRAKGLVA